MIDQTKKSDPGKAPAREIPDDSLEQVSGGGRPLKPLNPQPLPPISF